MSELSPRLRLAFAELAAESAVLPSAAFPARARAAMHTAVESRAARRAAWAPLRGLAGRRTAALGAALATASVLVAGWSAPPGSSLHAVRLVREQLTLALPGGDRAGRELGFAEDRLREATRASDRAAALTEASSLLAAAAHDLHGGAGAQWGRWSRDEARLLQAEATGRRGGGASGPAPTVGGSGGGGTSPGGGSGGAGPNPLPAGGPSGGDGPHRESASPAGRAGAPVGGGSGHHDGGAPPTAAATTSPSTSPAAGASGSGRDGAGTGRVPGGGLPGKGGGGDLSTSSTTTSTSTSSSAHRR